MPPATAIPQAAPASIHPLRNPPFRRLWIGTTVSMVGDQFYLVALPWLILSRTASSVKLGTIMMMAAVPRAVLMLLGGAVSDAFSPRRIMMTTAVARCVFVAAVGGLVWQNALELWHLYVLALAFGVADAFSGPASQTFLPSIVDPGQIPAANATNQTTAQLTTIIAPGPAGMVVKALGTAWAFVIDAVSFLFILGALWSLPDPPSRSSGPRKNVLGAIGEGLRYISNDVALRSILMVAAALNFCLAGPFSVALAWIAKTRFASPLAFSVLVSAVAAGGLLGALAAGFFKVKRRGRLFLGAATYLALCCAVVGLLPKLWEMATLLLVMGAAAAFVNVQIVSWLQQRVAREMLGRTMSVVMFSVLGLQPISLLLTGIAIRWSIAATFAVAGTLMLVVIASAAMHGVVREID